MPDDREPGKDAADAPRTPNVPRVEAEHVCDVCGSPMFEVHCKITCPNCGYRRDCSDPF